MFKHVLIPTDGSPVAAKAIQAGVALAKEMGAERCVAEVGSAARAVGVAFEPLVSKEPCPTRASSKRPGNRTATRSSWLTHSKIPVLVFR